MNLNKTFVFRPIQRTFYKHHLNSVRYEIDCWVNELYLLNVFSLCKYHIISSSLLVFAGTATVCLQNLRKTFKYGGRKNVPSVEEITAISAGRNSKRQIYRLPGGTERVVNTKSTTVVQVLSCTFLCVIVLPVLLLLNSNLLRKEAVCDLNICGNPRCTPL